RSNPGSTMAAMRRRIYSILIATVAVLSLAVFALSARAARSADLNQYLHDRYQGKTLLIRGFYEGDHLTYDSSGNLISKGSEGDWTADGFVALDRIHAKGPSLAIE